jgi:hypothetical protein
MLKQLFLEAVQCLFSARGQCFKRLVIGVKNELVATQQKVEMIKAVDFCRQFEEKG